MPAADVVVVGSGLAGLTAAIRLADGGARVEVVTRGHAATHWTAGGFDVAAPAGVRDASSGIRQLAAQEGHPYATLGPDVDDALDWLLPVLAAEGLAYEGDLETELRAVPTAIGGTRRASILPWAQAAALRPWGAGERLIVCGIAGFKDFWPTAIAASLLRDAVWTADGPPGQAGDRPDRVDPLVVDLPGVAGRRNLTALVIARLFDDPLWRTNALGRIARAINRLAIPAGGRLALPAVLGLRDHAGVTADAARILPVPFFEIPLVPPSVPGLRLYDALRSALRRRGGRLVVGEAVLRVETDGDRVVRVVASAAARERAIRTGGLVLATGGIAGGGLVARADGQIEEPVLGLPVEAPAVDAWLSADPFDPAGHPLERAGIRTDPALRPVDSVGRVLFGNVTVVGSLLAGQRYLAERCGDGVAIASGVWAAASFGAGPSPAGANDALGVAQEPARRQSKSPKGDRRSRAGSAR